MDAELNQNSKSRRGEWFQGHSDVGPFGHYGKERFKVTQSYVIKSYLVLKNQGMALRAKLKINHCSEYFQRSNHFNGKILSLIYYDRVVGLQAIRDNSKVQPYIHYVMKTSLN